jgi:hypothetical protein
MARSLNIVIGANIEKLRAGFNDAISVIKKAGGEMSADVAKSAKSIEEKLAAIATRNPTMGTVKQLTQLAMEARALGPEFAASADQFIREAGRIKDSIGDARGEVAYFASDTRRLDAVLGGVQAVAGAFGALQGVTALLGIEDENLQKTMVKLQAAMAVVSGAQAIQNALQAESAVMIGIQTAATKVQAYVMGQATVAARVYSAALLATGAGAIIVAIGLVVTMFQKSGRAIEEAKVKLAALEKQQERGLTLGQRRIKEEERALDLLVSRAQAEGKSEQYIYNLKKASLEKQKGIYKQYGKEALDLLFEQRAQELYTVESNSKEATAIRKKYAQMEADLRYSINNEYQGKVASLQMDADNVAKSARKNNLKDHKQDLDEQVSAEELAAVRIAYLKSTGVTEKIQNNERQGLKVIDPAPIDIKAPQKLEHTFTKIDYAMQNQLAKQEEYEEGFKKSMEGVNQAFNSLTADGLEAFGVLLGDIMTGQVGSFQDFGKKLLGAIAGFMKSFGQALIATATASKAFKELLISNPVLAAAAGVALVAGSAVITNMLNKGPEMTAFAEGGIVSGPTLGLVGEYPGASSNPEVIAPLDKLKGMLNTNDQSGFVASTSIQGRDLAIVLERYNKDRNRG